MLRPITIPIDLVLLAHAWIIPELYAARGARAVRAWNRGPAPGEQVALGLLGDLLDDSCRALRRRTGLVLERGQLGVWLIGEQGAMLIAGSGRRVWCFCVKAVDAELPPSDRLAHLLLAMRADEAGFATVANLVFSGAPWRVRRSLSLTEREALDSAVAQTAR